MSRLRTLNPGTVPNTRRVTVHVQTRHAPSDTGESSVQFQAYTVEGQQLTFSPPQYNVNTAVDIAQRIRLALLASGFIVGNVRYDASTRAARRQDKQAAREFAQAVQQTKGK